MNNDNQPLVSVIIPSYNHGHYLGRCLQSLVDQSYPNWEAIIVDNHSSDDTDVVVAKFADERIQLLKIRNDGVIAVSRNMGIRSARGEWLAFLDSDDWWTTDKLQVCMTKGTGAVDFIYHRLKISTTARRFFQRNTIKTWRVKRPVMMDLMLAGNAIATSSVVVRTSIVQAVGGMNEDKNVVAAEDYNTWLKIAHLSDNFEYIPRILGFYTVHAMGMSQRDMSIPMRFACAPFVTLLTKPQKLKHDANWRYARGRHAFRCGDFLLAKQDFLYCILRGGLEIKIKSAAMTIIGAFSLKKR